MTETVLPALSLDLQNKDAAGFAERLGASFREYGFAVIADHGVPADLIAQAEEDMRVFFALPEDVKRAYHVPGAAGARGFTPFGTEIAKDAKAHDLKEFWHIGRALPADHQHAEIMPPNIWPKEVARFEQTFAALFDALDKAGIRILDGISDYLDIGRDLLRDGVTDGNSVLRLLHYPPISVDAPGVRAGAHEDINTITLLLGAEEAGLELKDRSGRWLPVAPPPGALVVNIGDMLSRLTNDVLPSTSHRVVNPPPERRGNARYSMPFFLHFRPDFLIETLPSCLDGRENRYPEPITAQNFLEQRLREIGLA
ncbi:isopenicillin N synthase family oxygenase [Pacificimonas sp. WHA3]|uniref:2-oxoglutarate-dependent ethylene/succinate-forming enzyme n=1 Tax=Pacificimonas pallii TaxID=2827236 RepID=A0ABS6SH90_9SPHN|nr:2-oxoglutarate and iron-dependent oxygenase domain-containing protein [Pacificimonas pallii]MBV7257783.1 isopenicillin N synthase family oxygenase [Pacificimonas pallii]